MLSITVNLYLFIGLVVLPLLIVAGVMLNFPHLVMNTMLWGLLGLVTWGLVDIVLGIIEYNAS